MKWHTTKEGIVFAFDDELPITADPWSSYPEDRVEARLAERERFAEEEFRKPEHRQIVTGLRRLNGGLAALKSGWQAAGRQHALSELEHLLRRQHELELAIERLESMFLREYARDLLDRMATERRSLTEEVRWDVAASMSVQQRQKL